MKTHLNTLFVTLEGAYLHKDGAAVEIRHEGVSKLRVPLHNLEGIVCFGWNTVASAGVMAACSEAQVSLSFHNPNGRFLAATRGFASGNIHLRREQYRKADDAVESLQIATHMVAAKLSNSRTVLLRARRDHGEKEPERASRLRGAADEIRKSLRYSMEVADLDSLRGVEGDAAAEYFGAFSDMILLTGERMQMRGRNRRPPLDPINALLSFCYSLLMHDCRSALDSCGLDPQCGYLHRDRPGRPSLALDLMEEFRAYVADRVALNLLNRRQITEKDFDYEPSGAVMMKEDSRKKVLVAWQERKKEEVLHPFTKEKCTLGLLPHLQARLLARFIRGDLDAYPAFLCR
ncbi:type I-C CRISPR-associated endonuclease Cas1c [Pelagicoccus sp. SDUM812002]|uniref:type I-C CRISPR-associated endonuclease Cas1c n=1 Tax=Pelagicoccus sp. SDUM812002 TaxID=3041266 RepID=UPI00280F54EA|nr:type I-C CRISPR-associated endonuclease Cas1c [Pelagicoccus sp. SDUM812002]MDQ8187496.1 type I-C CRISPR-associated endonuclease Cas1c [Pelagicoccus sp. SDUM812002]